MEDKWQVEGLNHQSFGGLQTDHCQKMIRMHQDIQFVSHRYNLQFMAIPVVEFSRVGYKIRKFFG